MVKRPPIYLFTHPTDRRRGILCYGALKLPCALGRSGVVSFKREGDGGTPYATLRPVRIYFRRDRWQDRQFALPYSAISPHDGWCDDVTSPRYNRAITLPSAQSHETLWRQDHLYDVVIETDWNRNPAIRGRGSAIFIHLARPLYTPTEGCIALDRKGLKLLLPLLRPLTRIVVHPESRNIKGRARDR